MQKYITSRQKGGCICTPLTPLNLPLLITTVTFLTIWTLLVEVVSSFIPKPYLKNWKKDLVTLTKFLVCAESAYYVKLQDHMVAVQLLLIMALQS